MHNLSVRPNTPPKNTSAFVKTHLRELNQLRREGYTLEQIYKSLCDENRIGGTLVAFRVAYGRQTKAAGKPVPHGIGETEEAPISGLTAQRAVNEPHPISQKEGPVFGRSDFDKKAFGVMPKVSVDDMYVPSSKTVR